MRYTTRILLRRLLPVVFWLLAVGGSIGAPFFFANLNNANYWWGYAVTAFVLLAMVVAKHIDRHQPCVSQMFQITAILGIASYWLPTVLFLIVPFYIYAIWKATFSFKAFLAILIAGVMDAFYAAIFIYLGWINNTWEHFFEPGYVWGWISVGAVLTAWLATTISRSLLRER